MSSNAVIRFKNVGKRFVLDGHHLDVLKDITFSVRNGEFIAITGPSGAGKSTLLNLAALLDPPTSGELWFDQHSVDGLNDDQLSELRKNSIGMVFQKYNLLPHRSVLENVLFRFRYIRQFHGDKTQAAHTALEQVGLENMHDHPARLLSGGEMQRVAIARAIVLKPKLLVADEPTGNLDRAASERVMQLLGDLNKHGLSILLVTHNENLLSWCQRHLVCDDGRLTETL